MMMRNHCQIAKYSTASQAILNKALDQSPFSLSLAPAYKSPTAALKNENDYEDNKEKKLDKKATNHHSFESAGDEHSNDHTDLVPLASSKMLTTYS